MPKNRIKSNSIVPNGGFKIIFVNLQTQFNNTIKHNSNQFSIYIYIYIYIYNRFELCLIVLLNCVCKFTKIILKPPLGTILLDFMRFFGIDLSFYPSGLA